MQSGEAEGDKRAQPPTSAGHQPYAQEPIRITQPFRAQVLEALKQRGYCSRFAKSGIGTSSKNILIRLICVFPLCSGVSSTFGRRCFQTGLAPLHPLRLFLQVFRGVPHEKPAKREEEDGVGQAPSENTAGRKSKTPRNSAGTHR